MLLAARADANTAGERALPEDLHPSPLHERDAGEARHEIRHQIKNQKRAGADRILQRKLLGRRFPTSLHCAARPSGHRRQPSSSGTGDSNLFTHSASVSARRKSIQFNVSLERIRFIYGLPAFSPARSLARQGVWYSILPVFVAAASDSRRAPLHSDFLCALRVSLLGMFRGTKSGKPSDLHVAFSDDHVQPVFLQCPRNVAPVAPSCYFPTRSIHMDKGSLANRARGAVAVAIRVGRWSRVNPQCRISRGWRTRSPRVAVPSLGRHLRPPRTASLVPALPRRTCRANFTVAH